MSIRAMLLCAGVALGLSACGNQEDAAATAPAQAASEAPAAAAAETPAAVAAAAPAKGAAPTKEYIVGKWGENGDCTLALEFKADGSMVGPFERWSLAGDQLTMEGNPDPMTMSVVDENTMESRRKGQGPRKITRC